MIFSNRKNTVIRIYIHSRVHTYAHVSLLNPYPSWLNPNLSWLNPSLPISSNGSIPSLSCFNPHFHHFSTFSPAQQLHPKRRSTSSVLGLWRNPGATAGSRHRDPPGPAVLRTERWDSQPCPARGRAMGRASDQKWIFLVNIFLLPEVTSSSRKSCGTLFCERRWLNDIWVCSSEFLNGLHMRFSDEQRFYRSFVCNRLIMGYSWIIIVPFLKHPGNCMFLVAQHPTSNLAGTMLV